MVVPNTGSSDEGELSRAKTLNVDALGLTIIDPNTFKLNNKDSKFNNDSQNQLTEKKSSFKFFLRRGTDMKFRLGFFKLRHTEDTLTQPSSPPSSISPSPEEVRKWAESFQDLMNSKYGQSLFRAFLRREFSDENIEFWVAVEDFKGLSHRKLRTKAQAIVNEFVLPHSPREVNLDLATKNHLISVTTQSTADCSTFDQAQKRIQGILESDAYVRFLQSDFYLQLLLPAESS